MSAVEHPADEFLAGVEHGLLDGAWREVGLRIEHEDVIRGRVETAVELERARARRRAATARRQAEARARGLALGVGLAAVALTFLATYNVLTNGWAL